MCPYFPWTFCFSINSEMISFSFMVSVRVFFHAVELFDGLCRAIVVLVVPDVADESGLVEVPRCPSIYNFLPAFCAA